ncbi:MAG: hypothetical protein V3S25_08910 [Nitrospirales bacterium]
MEARAAQQGRESAAMMMQMAPAMRELGRNAAGAIVGGNPSSSGPRIHCTTREVGSTVYTDCY